MDTLQVVGRKRKGRTSVIYVMQNSQEGVEYTALACAQTKPAHDHTAAIGDARCTCRNLASGPLIPDRASNSAGDSPEMIVAPG